MSSEFMVCYDHQRRTCLKVAEHGEIIEFIPLDIAEGFQVQQTTVGSFNQRFKTMPDYPIEQGCQLYFNYCLAVGASDEVLDYLSQVVTITKEDREMAKSKFKSKGKAVAPKKKTVKKKAVKKKVAAKKSPGRGSKSPSVKKRSKKSSNTYSSAAQMFQGLIMEGKLTDDEIFEQVQAEFGLDDKKRGYVKWYRNNLKKKGENPPEAK